jgi:hypothetical protein
MQISRLSAEHSPALDLIELSTRRIDPPTLSFSALAFIEPSTRGMERPPVFSALASTVRIEPASAAVFSVDNHDI